MPPVRRRYAAGMPLSGHFVAWGPTVGRVSTALVTGATAGIGLEFARQLAERGHDLVLVARDEARLAGVAADLHARYGVHGEVLAADLTDRDQLERVARRLAGPDHPVDLLVNNAGFGLKHPFLVNDVADEERMFDVLCRAVLVLSHAAARAMSARGHGAVVTVSSVAGFTTMGSYSAAKAWATTFTEALAAELSGTGVRAIALCPGYTRTEFHGRADVDVSSVPPVVWLQPDRLVRDCLRDLDRGRVVSVPGVPYKLLVAALQVTPRALIRAATARTGRIGSRRR